MFNGFGHACVSDKEDWGQEGTMTTLAMRMIKGHFVVSGPDVEPMKFKSRSEAKDRCKTHYRGSPITEVGPSPLGGFMAVRFAPDMVRGMRVGSAPRRMSPA
jgi:hypothetical protein